jgi:hypothetical protein
VDPIQPNQLAQTVMKNLLSLPELPNSILKQAAKGRHLR